MKKVILFFTLISSAVFAQAQLVSNVRAMQQDTTLVIVYDLRGQANTNLQVSFDGGATYKPAQTVAGDIGRSTPAGNNRIVYWNATKDAGYFDCDKMVFKVTASGRIAQERPVAQGTPGQELEYRYRHVYQNGNEDITRGYKNFLRSNCPEAYRAYKRKWHGMFWGGMLTTFCAAPFCVGALVDGSSFGLGACFSMMSACILTGIPLMCCSTVAARRHSVKVYNNTCGMLDATAFESHKTPEQVVQLSLGPTSQGVGLSVQF